MAFILANKTTLSRDMWPAKVAVIKQEQDVTTDTLPSARMVPDDEEELTEWLWVDHQPELSRALVYVRNDVPGAEESDLELVVRIQGVIADMNLNVGGNWDGSEMNAKKATQHVTLVSGGQSEAFEPQIRTLTSLREVILLHLGVCDEVRPGRPGTISLRRKVFTKIRGGLNDQLPSVVKNAEDPKGKFDAVRHQWRVTERVQAGTHLAHGAVYAIPPLALRRGDFVDVSARVTVAVMRSSGGRRFEVAFEPTTIVRMADAARVKAIFNPVPRKSVRARPPKAQEGRRTMDIGFAFQPEADGADMEVEKGDATPQ